MYSNFTVASSEFLCNSMQNSCFYQFNKSWVYKYILYESHILASEKLGATWVGFSKNDFKDIEMNKSIWEEKEL